MCITLESKRGLRTQSNEEGELTYNEWYMHIKRWNCAFEPNEIAFLICYIFKFSHLVNFSVNFSYKIFTIFTFIDQFLLKLETRFAYQQHYVSSASLVPMMKFFRDESPFLRTATQLHLFSFHCPNFKRICICLLRSKKWSWSSVISERNKQAANFYLY